MFFKMQHNRTLIGHYQRASNPKAWGEDTKNKSGNIAAVGLQEN